MAFKLTYTDGVADDYGDDTVWEVDDGVLKMGREEGKWTVLVSPSHWATIELGTDRKDDGDDKKDDEKKDKDKKKTDEKSEDDDEDDSDEDEDDKDDKGKDDKGKDDKGKDDKDDD